MEKTLSSIGILNNMPNLERYQLLFEQRKWKEQQPATEYTLHPLQVAANLANAKFTFL